MIALEAIVTSRTFLNQSPGKPDQLVLLVQSRRGTIPAVSSRRRFPRHGLAPAKIVAITGYLFRLKRKDPSFI
ncbi:hypothetical protein [Mesorhizobium tianshanense]|nr:hypothetical protein [Mesorhizobium tianshanense]